MPRKASNPAPVKAVKKNGEKVVRKNNNSNKLPPPFPKGEILKDAIKQTWKLGKSIGSGGFGEIYSAAKIQEGVTGDEIYVVKIEPHSNGPLFSEMHFYQRVAKKLDIDEWKSQHGLEFLGMPNYVASGSHDFKDEKYRFLVMQRFGCDIQSKLAQSNNMLSLKDNYTISLKVIDVLEYIHSKDYIHADIKASNLLLGYGKGKENEVYLVDFGLALKYVLNGTHKECRNDPKRAHDGTIEFASRDAHDGMFSRRSDLETLAFNMLQWACGKLPWEDKKKDCNLVMDLKKVFMHDIKNSLKRCFPKGNIPTGLEDFIKYVLKLSFEELPDYEHLRKILKSSMKKEGIKMDGKLEFKSNVTASKRRSQSEMVDQSPKKRKPLRPKNSSPDMSFETDDSNTSCEEITTGVVPTPAMLLVMKNRQNKKQPAKKRGNTPKKDTDNKSAKQVKKNGCAAKIVQKSNIAPESSSRSGRPAREGLRRSPRARNQVIFTNSISPEM